MHPSPLIPPADAQHRRLVRYYERVFGFVALREVGGNGLRDLPDLLVWGGQGARFVILLL